MSTTNEPTVAAPPEMAFPHDPGEVIERTKGLTIRDYFAAKAMQGRLADPNIKAGPDMSTQDFAEECAKKAYVYADAMLAARK